MDLHCFKQNISGGQVVLNLINWITGYISLLFHSKIYLTQSWMNFLTLICWTSPFQFWGAIFIFISSPKH